MDVRARSPQDPEQLRQLIRTERDAAQRDRYRAVTLAVERRQTKEIVEMLGRSRAFVQRWVYAYRDGGLEAIGIKKPPGKKPLLPRDRWDELRTRLDAGPTDDDAVCAFRGRDIRTILHREFGVKYSLNGVYELLHRMGYSWLAPRPRHRHADAKAQEAFKASAPFLSTRCASVIPASEWKSGSRMN